MSQETQEIDRLLRLKEVLTLIPVSQSAWWKGIKKGIYPQPVKLSPRVTTWRLSEIRALIESAGNELP